MSIFSISVIIAAVPIDFFVVQRIFPGIEFRLFLGAIFAVGIAIIFLFLIFALMSLIPTKIQVRDKKMEAIYIGDSCSRTTIKYQDIQTASIKNAAEPPPLIHIKYRQHRIFQRHRDAKASFGVSKKVDLESLRAYLHTRLGDRLEENLQQNVG